VTGLEFVDPVGGVDAEDIVVCGGFGREEVVGLRDAVVEQRFVNQAVFLRGEDVFAQMEIVVGMIDDFEGSHRPL